jgi:hypothetical protein
MLTHIQRDAMTRAQAGDFKLLDALEVLEPNRQRFRNIPLAGGINVGGRLRLLAYGGGRREVGTMVSGAQQYITTLNGEVAYGPATLRSNACPDLEISWTTTSAALMVAEYHQRKEEAERAEQLELLTKRKTAAAA